MTTFLRGLVAAALASALVAGPASAASVSVRVEGDTATLVPRTTVQTAPGRITKDGDPAHACDAQNAIGALERATAGDWGGPWSSSFGYLVEEIRGETHDAATQTYWRISVDGADATAGVCDLALRDGQELLFSPAGYTSSPPLLELTAPAVARAGAPVTVEVAELSPAGQATPRAGATVTVGGASGVTDAQGRAVLQIAALGDVELRAEAPGAIRDTGETICVHDASGGRCGVPGAPAGPAAPGPASGAGGAAADVTAPAALVTSIREGDRFARRRVSRAIAGVAGTLRRDAGGRLRLAGPDPSGLRAVKLRLTRRDGERCWAWSRTRERFRGSRCGVERAPWFAIGAEAEWRFELPRRLPAGRYVLDVTAVDGAGNRDDARRRGQNRVVFRVR